MNVQARNRVRLFLARQRSRLTNEQWMQSYLSWARGGHGWNPYGMGGTDINTALAWYQHIYKPGCREWRPKIIMRVVAQAAEGELMYTRGEQEAIPVGAKVRITARCVDFHFFPEGCTGVVVRNSGTYLGIIVKLDEPIHVRYYTDRTWLMEEWGFNANHLQVLDQSQGAGEAVKLHHNVGGQ